MVLHSSEPVFHRRLIQSSGQNSAAPWVDPDTASSDAVLASALDEMQFKLSATDLDNARLRVELVRVMSL